MTNSHRSSQGCWTCRLRKKKCDESHPRCNLCETLGITCHFSEGKPAWMEHVDSRSQMLLQIKREIREHAKRRPRGQVSLLRDGAKTVSDVLDCDEVTSHGPNRRASQDAVAAEPDLSALSDRLPNGQADAGADKLLPISQAEKVMVACYSEYVLPLVFPAYRPCMHDGGRAWFSENAAESSTIRKIIYLHGAFYHAASCEAPNLESLKTSIHQMSRGVLVSAIVTTQILATKSAQERVYGGLAVLLSIMQVRHFNKIASIHISSLDCLNVAIKVYERLLMYHETTSLTQMACTYGDLSKLLGCPTFKLEIAGCNFSFPGIETSALELAVGQLVFDDIIASTTLGVSPSLQSYHKRLLSSSSFKSTLDLEKVVGCPSFVGIQISHIAVLAEWKRDRKDTKTLDIVDLVRKMTMIQGPLEQYLSALNEDSSDNLASHDISCCMSIFERRLRLARRCIWSHAALIYLHTVAAGLQYGHAGVQQHISSVLSILESYNRDASLLRTVAWPFFVSGCLASEAEQGRFVELSQDLRTTAISGSIQLAQEILTVVWSRRASEDEHEEEFAQIFQSVPEAAFLF